MAFEGADRARIARSALGHIAQADGHHSAWTLARALRAQFGEMFPAQSHAAYQAIAQQVLRTVEAAKSVERRTVNVIERADLPIDPTIGDDDAPIRYRVLVTAMDPTTGESLTYAIDMHSEVPILAEAIHELARTTFAASQPRASYRDALARLGDAPTVSVVVLTAGRRG